MSERLTAKEWVAQIKAKDAAEAERKAATRAATNQEYRQRKEAEAQAKAQREQEMEAQRQAERAAEFDSRYKRPARASFLRTGGTVEEFEAQWPTLRAEIRQGVIKDEMDKNRRANAERMRRAF